MLSGIHMVVANLEHMLQQLADTRRRKVCRKQQQLVGGGRWQLAKVTQSWPTAHRPLLGVQVVTSGSWIGGRPSD